MTDEGAGAPVHPGGIDERAARLQALLSVDLDLDGRTPAGPTRRSSAVDDDPRRRAPVPEPSRSGSSGTGSVLWAVALVALFAAGLAMAYAGTRIIRSSTQGQIVEPVDDPAAPGFEALVESTPTLAVLHDLDEQLVAITVLSLPDPGGAGGGVVFVPTRVVDELPLFGVTTLATAYDLGAAPQTQAEMVGDLLGVGIDDVVVVDADRWAGLLAPVAPLEIDNPTDVAVDGEVLFPEGPLSLDVDEVGPFLEARGDDESDLARLYRHELLWRAWLDAVGAAGGEGTVPGELESGLGRFVPHLAAGAVRMATVPVERTDSAEWGEEPAFLPDETGIEALVAELVPFPRSPRPGERERVRVLNGTDDVDAGRRVAPGLPPLGLEVVIVGNARRLDHEQTTIAYAHPGAEAAARDVRDLLGVGDVILDPRPSDVVEITVTLGADHD